MLIKEILRRLYYFNTFRRLKSKGKKIQLSKGGSISRPSELSIGSNVFIGKGFVISARDMVIGNNIMIGPYLLAECDDHVFDEVGKTMYETRTKRTKAGITIENDVWVGGQVTILKGVTISEGCIIGAGSIVTKSTVPYTINFGNPCKPFKTRFSRKELKEHLELVNSAYSFAQIISLWEKTNL
jgi:acetyltransferase-like isoleucine patch superfamily enzyme